MASERGLFDRLREPDRRAQRSAQQRTDQVYGSVLRHLQFLLNTRHDDCPTVPDFGLPPLSDIDISTRAEDLRRAIEQTLRSYEPRLANVRVAPVPSEPGDPLKIRFQITAGLVTDDERVRVRFDTLVDAGGSWKVTG